MSVRNDVLEGQAKSRWQRVLDNAERFVLWSFVLMNLVFPAALYISGLPRPWKAFYGETSYINWFSSVQCAILATLGLAVFFITRLGRAVGSDPVRRSWPWIVLFLGFALMSFDEKFEIHERVRKNVLRPHGVMTNVPGLKPGDIVLPLYAVAGVVLTLVLVGDLRRYRRSLVVFVAALTLIVIIAVQDSLSLRVFKIPTVRHMQIVVEEVGEVWAQALFAVSLVLHFFHKLRAFLDVVSSRTDN